MRAGAWRMHAKIEEEVVVWWHHLLENPDTIEANPDFNLWSFMVLGSNRSCSPTCHHQDMFMNLISSHILPRNISRKTQHLLFIFYSNRRYINRTLSKNLKIGIIPSKPSLHLHYILHASSVLKKLHKIVFYP